MNHLKHRSIFMTILIAAVLVAAGGFWLRARTASSANTAINAATEATGVIESRNVALSSEIGGKVVEVLVEEGQQVKLGQPLVSLDDSLLQKQRAQAESAMQVAQANLRLAQAAFNQATAASRPEDITAMQARLSDSRAAYYAITVTLTDSQLEKLRSAVTTAESNLKEAQSRYDDLAADNHNPAFAVAAAQAAVDDAKLALASAQRASQLANDKSQPYYLQIESARLSWELAQGNLSQAKARRDGLDADADTTDAALKAARSTVTESQDMLDAAKAAYDALTSGVSADRLDAAWEEIKRAQTQLTGYGVRASGVLPVETLLAQIDVAQAQVKAAQAQLDTLDTQLSKLTLIAPSDGVVLTRSIEPGGMALPGATLIEIGRLDKLELTIYLPEEKFGLVAPGQTVRVSVDAYPGRVFDGTVLRMADKAEFTPTSVQTKEDRTRLVYAMVISLDNPDMALKPGMIADVNFTTGPVK